MGHKTRTKKANVKGKTKAKKALIWPEAQKDYPVLKLDLRPQFFAASYKKLMDDIVLLLGKEVDSEMKKLPKKDRKPSKVNGKQYTAEKGSGGFLLHLLPASGDPKDEVILLYGLDDLYLHGFHDGEVWFVLAKATVPIPPSTQVPYGRPAGLDEKQESPFDNGIYLLPWSGSYLDLEDGQNQRFHSEAFRSAFAKLKNAQHNVLTNSGRSLQRPLAVFIVGIAEAFRFENIGDWVLNQSTNLSLIEENGIALLEEYSILVKFWATESDNCYGPDPPKYVRVVKRNPVLHMELKTEITYQKKEIKKAQIKEEVEENSEEEDKEELKSLVPVKETIEGEGVCLIESLEGPLKIVETSTPNGKFSVKVRVYKLPDALSTMLDDCAVLLSDIMCSNPSQDVGSSATYLREQMIIAIDSVLEAISGTVENSRAERYKKTLLGHFQRIWALGPSQAAPNILLLPDVNVSDGPTISQDGKEGILVSCPCHISKKLGFVLMSEAETDSVIDNGELSPYSKALRNSIVLGFQLATCNGPLCDEPMWGLAFIVEPYIFAENPDDCLFENNTFSWQVTRAVEEACVAAVRKSKPIILEPLCLCELTVPSHRLDAARTVIEDCRGKVLREDMPDGAPLFTVHAHLPAAESSKFSHNLKKRTSAAAHAQLTFSHWEAIPQNPLFIPKTKEEIDKFGDGPNLARTLVDSVRQRKGLPVEELGKEHHAHAKKIMGGRKQIKEDIDKDMAIDEETVQGSLEGSRSGLEVLEPLVSFKETVLGVSGHMQFIERTTPDGKFSVRIGVFRLPDDVTKMLDDSADLLAETIGSQSSQDAANAATDLRDKMIRAMDSGLEAISGRVGVERCQRYRRTVLGHFQRIWALGPTQAAPNLLVMRDVKSSNGLMTNQDGRKGILLRSRCHVSERLGFLNAEIDNSIDNSALATDVPEPDELKNSIILGFEIATGAGPLCDEPMWGLAFIVEPYTFVDSSIAAGCSSPYQQRIFNWHVSNTVREACLAAVLQSNPRLVQPMYLCELTTPTEDLGAVHAVLSDCRAKVLKEEMQEGTSLFTVHANLPVVESSEFSKKLRNGTSGAAIVHLAKSHWEAISQDPFFIPKTQEEIEKFGDGPNFARTLMHSVRRRKGLRVEDEVLEDGTKQL